MSVTDLAEASAIFLQERGFRKTTAATYKYGLQAFRAFAQENYNDQTLGALSPDCLADFYRWMVWSRGRGYSHYTATVYISAVRQMLEWLDGRGWLPPTFSLVQAERQLADLRDWHNQPRYRQRPVDNRAPQIVAYYDNLSLSAPNASHQHQQRLIILRNRALVHVLYATAARVGEVISLTRQQVRDGHASEVPIVGRGNKRRVLSLDPDTRAAIRAYLNERSDRNPWLFIPHNGRHSGHIGRVTVWHIIKEAVHALNLDEATSPHTLRHYRAIHLLNNGMSPEDVQALLGHASVATTHVVYTNTSTPPRAALTDASRSTLRGQIEQQDVPAQQAARTDKK